MVVDYFCHPLNHKLASELRPSMALRVENMSSIVSILAERLQTSGFLASLRINSSLLDRAIQLIGFRS